MEHIGYRKFLEKECGNVLYPRLGSCCLTAAHAEVFHMETENWKKHFADVPWAMALDRNGVIFDGDVNEAQAIQQHCDFSFDVLSASAEEFHNVYRPEFTPYAYVLNADRTIAYMGHVGEVTTTKGTIAQLGLMPVVEEVSRS
ncbi:MAG: hypothetical protein E6230_12295 [Paenibacillus dendritiformis]|uniref:hypothetical protein n=1 Tax=Paenibacillus dendritiformis TaxID=130049 RepID=UPI001B139B11|nr:hypothetical protein [Paenibacillus dendritiformis]MDU5142961.1 hypothetical protein [Paenibacillus dendritiformis]GIO75875.1 hypothetical protein J27TS7_53890 [Paenibacillus dendritiformis]